MPFENPAVVTPDLPILEVLSFTGLSKRYYRFRVVRALVLLVLLGSLLTAALYVAAPPVSALIAISLLYCGIVVLVLIEELKGFPLRGYILRKHDMTYRRGYFFQKQITVPFNRLQHSEVSLNPVGRLFGLADLEIFTAGGASADLKIQGLNKALCFQLRDFIAAETAQHV